MQHEKFSMLAYNTPLDSLVVGPGWRRWPLNAKVAGGLCYVVLHLWPCRQILLIDWQHGMRHDYTAVEIILTHVGTGLLQRPWRQRLPQPQLVACV